MPFVPLKSDQGQKLLREVRGGNGLIQPPLLGVFRKQKGDVNCGVQTIAMALGANEVGRSNPGLKVSDEVEVNLDDLKYTEAKMFTFPETLKLIDQDGVNLNDGLSLDQVFGIIRSHGVDAEEYFTDVSSLEQFREAAKEALARADSSAAVLVNYHMKTLGQKPEYGHHSPLGAYHEETDQFLLLDVWRETEECWAKAADLFKAMDVTDDSTGKKRGYIILKF